MPRPGKEERIRMFKRILNHDPKRCQCSSFLYLFALFRYIIVLFDAQSMVEEENF